VFHSGTKFARWRKSDFVLLRNMFGLQRKVLGLVNQNEELAVCCTYCTQKSTHHLVIKIGQI